MLNTKSGLAALGVDALRPPDVTIADHAPTVNDYVGYTEPHLWFYKSTRVPPVYELWFLANKAPVSGTNAVATWLKIYPNTSTDNGGNLQTDDDLIAYPDTEGNIHVLSGEAYGGNPAYINLYTKNYDAYTMQVAMKRSLNFPFTNSTGTEGMYKLGDRNFMFSIGPRNTILGTDALNLNISLTSCVDNTVTGYNSLANLYDGAGNSAYGSNVMTDLISGSDNIGIGHSAGDAYDTSESSNIVIGSPGVVGDNNTIRIGIQGTGAAEQDKCFVAGIWNGTYAGALDTGIVIVNEDGQLYVDNVAPNSVLFTDNTGNLIGQAAQEGYILTGQGLTNVPEFKPLTSSGGSVAISYNATTKSVNLEATGVAGLSQLGTDAGTATPLAGEIMVAGGELITTDAITANTVTINLDRGADLEVIAGNTGAASTYKGLQSHDGSIVFDIVTYPGKIDMIATGGGGGGTLTYLSADTGSPATPVLGAVKIAGISEAGKNITTVSSTGKVIVNVTDDVDLAGYLYATTDIKTSTGNLEATDGLLKLPYSDGAGTKGQIQFGGNRFLSNYGTNNCFVGELSGNTSLNTGTAISNTYLGYQSGLGTVDAAHCVAAGYNSMRANQTGSNCTCIGDSSLLQATGSSYMTCLGYRSGVNYVGGTDNNIICIGNAGMTGSSNTTIIGTQGTGSGQQDKCYIHGIYGGTAGTGTSQLVAITADGKLYSTGSTSGVLSINGSTNINITGTPSIPQVNLNDWILLPATNSAGTAGGISINSIHFLHGYGTQNIFAGGAANLTLLTAYADENVGIGYDCLHSITKSQRNVFLGKEAGYHVKAGIGNSVGIGYRALYASTTTASSGAGQNVAIGSNCLPAATTLENSVFIGYYAGASALTGSGNVVIGYGAMGSATSPTNNICIGTNSGDNITSGDDNVYINSSGNATGGLNIYIGATSSSTSESNTIRIGTPIYQTAAYVSGIYTTPISGGNMVVVDSNGKLGVDSTSGSSKAYPAGGTVYAGTSVSTIPAWRTLRSTNSTVSIDYSVAGYLDLKSGNVSSCAFHAVQVPNATNLTGDGTMYNLGSSSILTEIYDYGNNFYPGNGTGTKALFTAPQTGLYFFIVTVLVTNLPVASTTRVDPIYIVTSNRTYALINPVMSYTNDLARQTVTFSAIADMDASDTAYFQYGLTTMVGTKTVGIGGTYTTVSGYLIG